MHSPPPHAALYQLQLGFCARVEIRVGPIRVGRATATAWLNKVRARGQRAWSAPSGVKLMWNVSQSRTNATHSLRATCAARAARVSPRAQGRPALPSLQ